jgi:hypothetical protein
VTAVQRPWRLLVPVVLVATSAGCDGATAEPGPTDAETAVTVCDALRDVNNRVVDAVNDSVAGIASRAPEERLPAIAEGAEAVDGRLAEWSDRIDDLVLPRGAEGDELRRQLVDGVAGARHELDDQRAEFDGADGPVPDGEVAGLVGTWFNAVEKIVSSLEPEIFRFERREFKQAFLDEPACRNVVQPFVND